MKTTTSKLFFVLSLILALLLFRECQSNKNCNLNEEEVINTFVNSRHTISIAETKSLYSNYKNRFIPKIKEIQVDPGNGIVRNDYLPTEYSLIPLQKLKDYINFLDILQEKNPNQIISGIAVNFGAYDLGVEFKDQRSTPLIDPIRIGDYSGRLTTFFTPTFYNDSIVSDYDADKHIPFCIDYDNASDKFKGTYVSLRDYIDTESDDPTIPQPQLMQTNSPTNNSEDDDLQSVSSNEFTDMPPKKPNLNGGN